RALLGGSRGGSHDRGGRGGRAGGRRRAAPPLSPTFPPVPGTAGIPNSPTSPAPPRPPARPAPAPRRGGGPAPAADQLKSGRRSAVGMPTGPRFAVQPRSGLPPIFNHPLHTIERYARDQ